MSVSACDFAEIVVGALEAAGLSLSPDAHEGEDYSISGQECVTFIEALVSDRDALLLGSLQLEALREDEEREVAKYMAGIHAQSNRCAALKNIAILRGEHRDQLTVALRAMLDVQSRRRHPLGQPDEHIAYDAADAASKARNALAMVSP